MSPEFEKTLAQRAAEAQKVVLSYLPAAEGRQERIYSAMEYCMSAGGKRLRPVIMLEAFSLFNANKEDIYPFMAAIEMIHNYSLIHDDLPAMDDDELRRGRKTCHVVYGEAMAILAGDGLLNLAFETAAGALLKRGGFAAGDMNGDGLMGEQGFDMTAPDPEYLARAASAINVLSQKAGCRGMIGGQVVDVLSEGQQASPVDMDTLLFIHEHKTAALLEAALMTGGIMGGASPEQISILEKIGSCIGLAFQIQDDILDVTGDEQQLGKPVGSDIKNEKVTYVSINGLEKSKKASDELMDRAQSLLKQLPGDHTFLSDLFEWLSGREK
ncbi:MAG: polyprenyl synthetase family protein [Lachnospiraceae bacterium]|nr:polyprenyl synthetase family protein [Lachnospiraceae bacterium]